MKTRLSPHLLAVGLGFSLLALPGCALTSKADPINLKYYSPPSAQLGPASGSAEKDRTVAHTDDAAVTLRLGRVRAADHLRNAIVYQKSDVELGEYDDDQWTERPSDYVERAMHAELFEKRGLAETLAGGGPMLDIEVLAFQEVRKGEGRSARVTLEFSLHDHGAVIDASTLTVEVPTRENKKDRESVVVAIGAAMDQASAKLAERVQKDLLSARLPTPATDNKEAANRERGPAR